MWRNHMRIGVYEAKSIEEIIKPTTVNGNDLKYGGRAVLPQIALEKCASRMQVPFPLIFKLRFNKKEVVCGVHSFEAKPGEILLTEWMKEVLEVEGNKKPKIEVWVLTKAVPKGTSALFQPLNLAFLDFSNPKAVLERSLRSFTCLGKDQVITICHNDKILRLRICKTEPEELILIIDCDLNVDFEAPPGYIEPQAVRKTIEAPPTPSTSTPGKRCDGKPLSAQQQIVPSTPKAVIPVGVPDFDYKIGSIKLDRRQVAKTTLKTATKTVVPKGRKLVEKPPTRRPVTRSQTQALKDQQPPQQPSQPGPSTSDQDKSPESMELD